MFCDNNKYAIISQTRQVLVYQTSENIRTLFEPILPILPKSELIPMEDNTSDPDGGKVTIPTKSDDEEDCALKAEQASPAASSVATSNADDEEDGETAAAAPKRSTTKKRGRPFRTIEHGEVYS